MTYGIAAYKVTPEFCEDEVEYILSIGGIEVKHNQELGKDIMLEELTQQYDAVFLGIGVGLTRNLAIKGEELEGVVDAIDFIYHLRDKGYSDVAVGDKVAVIGLGMTAIDAATQARRLGASEVTIVYRRTHAEMPCTQHEMDIALLDGVQFEWLAAPKEVLGKKGKVTGLVCSRMKLGEPDASGRRSPIETKDTFTLEVDMVIKATGQIPFVKLVEQSGLENKSGRISISSDSRTSAPKVFAGGDAVNGGKEVVDAVQAGKDGAKGILEFLGLEETQGSTSNVVQTIPSKTSLNQ
jgi:glutamate synthase (NADPH/NADH) small chain